MNKLLIILNLTTLFAMSIAQTNPTFQPHSNSLFMNIYNVSDNILTRLEAQTAHQQKYLLRVTLGFTLLECLLLITSLILHVVSITVLKASRIIAH